MNASPSSHGLGRRSLAGVLFLLFALQPTLAQGAPQTLDFATTLERALTGPSVVLAEGQVALAERQLEIASAPISAELSAGYSASVGSATGASGETEITTSSSLDAVGLQATFNVVPYGPSADAIQRARWSLEAAQRDLEDARADALIEAATRYLEAYSDTQEGAVLDAEVAAAQAALEATQARAEVGAANDAEVLAAEIELSQAENDRAALELDLSQALARLAQTLGVPVAGVSGGAPALTLAALDSLDPDTRLEARSDVTSAGVAVLQADLEKASTLRDYLPTGSLDLGLSRSGGDDQLRLAAGYNTNSYQPSLSLSYDPSVTGSGEGTSFTLSLGLTIPLESATPAALSAADLNVAQSEAQLEQTRVLARLELGGARDDLTAAEATVALAERLVTQRQDALDAAQTRFDLGLVSVLELQTAEVALLQAELQAGDAAGNLVLAAMTLARSLALRPTEVF